MAPFSGHGVVIPNTNYTNFTIGEKFRNFMELYNVVELYIFQNEFLILGYNSTTALVSCCCVHCCYLDVRHNGTIVYDTVGPVADVR